MSDDPFKTAEEEIKKWIDQIQALIKAFKEEQAKQQAKLAQEAKDALAAQRHDEMMKELRGIREGKGDGQSYSAPALEVDDDYEPPQPEVKYNYDADVKAAREFKGNIDQIPDGKKKAEMLREIGPEARKDFNDFRKKVEARPDSAGKEALLKELDEIDQMLDYEAYAQEHGIDLQELDGAGDLDVADINGPDLNVDDLTDGLEQGVKGVEQAADQASQGVKQAVGAVAGGAGGVPAPGMEAPLASAWKPGSVGEELKKQGMEIKRPGGPKIGQQREQSVKIGGHRR